MPRYVEKGAVCKDVFMCPDNKNPIEFQNLCDKVRINLENS